MSSTTSWPTRPRIRRNALNVDGADRPWWRATQRHDGDERADARRSRRRAAAGCRRRCRAGRATAWRAAPTRADRDQDRRTATSDRWCGRMRSPSSARLRLRSSPARPPVTSSTSSTLTPRHSSTSSSPVRSSGGVRDRCRGPRPVRPWSCALPPRSGFLGRARRGSGAPCRAGRGGCRPRRAGPRRAGSTAVGQRHRRRAVHDDEHRAAREDRAQRGLDGGLGVDVERRQRVVEHEDPGPADDRPGQGEALALAAGQRQALLADAGVEAPRQVEGEAGLRDLEGGRAPRPRWRRACP